MGGGTKKHVQLLVTGLIDAGVDVVLALPYERPFDLHSPLMDYSFPAYMQSRGVRVDRFHLRHGRIAPFADLRGLAELVLYLRRNRFDVVHTHSAKAGTLGRVAARLAQVPAVVHTPYSVPFRRELNQGRRYWLYYSIEKTLGSWTDVMIATSKAEYREITESGIIDGDRLELIHNCLDLENYSFDYDHRCASKRELGWPEQQPVVGTVGRLAPQKGIETLLESSPLVREQLPDVRFVIVGDGELRSKIEQRAATLNLNGTWKIMGQRDDYLRFMRAFDVFAFPSLWEGLPYAPIEAMAVGTPVVATSVIGNTDLIVHEDTGLLVGMQDHQSMADAIVRVLRDRELARRLALRGRAFVEEKFNTARPVMETLTAYEKVLRAKGRSL
jgi:glycosyltransferase involved in cell wall biosynthesis